LSAVARGGDSRDLSKKPGSAINRWKLAADLKLSRELRRASRGRRDDGAVRRLRVPHDFFKPKAILPARDDPEAMADVRLDRGQRRPSAS
jgi:hypothetical protein